MVGWSFGWLAGRLAGWLTGWLVGWLAGWLAGCSFSVSQSVRRSVTAWPSARMSGVGGILANSMNIREATLRRGSARAIITAANMRELLLPLVDCAGVGGGSSRPHHVHSANITNKGQRLFPHVRSCDDRLRRPGVQNSAELIRPAGPPSTFAMLAQSTSCFALLVALSVDARQG